MAIWGTKLGANQPDFPGSSPHVAHSDLSHAPYFTLVDCNNLQVTPLVDAGSCIWVCGTFRNSFKGVIKLDCFGNEVLRIPIEDQVVATPVLTDGYICLAIDNGVVASYGMDTGAERWTRRYAPGSGNDSWSMGYNQDILVLAGKSNEALPWNNCVYGVSVHSGSLRWKFEATLIIFFTPCMVHGSVIFQDMQCTVTSLRLSDGKASWQEKFKSQDKNNRQRSTSTGQAVACKSLNTVYAAANRPGKKEWNAQYGGQGCLRAFDLWSGKFKWQQDFDLEANTTPAIAASGPGGGPMVIVCLGATPGGPVKEGAFGDSWKTRIVALDGAAGAQLWAHDFDPWNHYGVRGSSIFQVYTPTAMTNLVIGADGTIFVGHCSGWLYAFRGSDGALTSGHDLGVAIQASPVVGPGFLVVASYEQVNIWRPWQDVSEIFEDGQPLAMDATTEHFCPFKGGGNCPGSSSYKAPGDVSRPAWSYELTGRRPHEFFYNSPVIDAQGHIIVSSRYNDLRVFRPDGTLRTRFHMGTALTNPALLGDKFFIGTGAGQVIAMKLTTFEVAWTRRYCVQANLDASSVVAAQGVVLLPGNSEIKRENKTMYCLDAADGHTRWTYDVKGVGMVDCRPVVLAEEGLVVFADADGGVYCVYLSDGSLLWETNKDQAHYHQGCHLCALEHTAQVFTTGSIRAEGRWGAQYGGKALIRCHDAGSGCHAWVKVIEQEELSVPAAVAPKHLPLFKPMLIVALGSRPGSPARRTEHGPDGSGCTGDAWYGRLVALDCQGGGALNWSRTMPPLRANSAPGNHADDVYRPPPFSAPIVGSDGTLYIAWGGGLFCAMEACTGRLLSTYDMGCAAAGSPAIAPGMICIMSAFRLLVWRNSEMEEAWRTTAALDGDPRAAASQSRAPADVPTVGLLRNVAADRFDPESLRAHEWGEEFLKLEALRKEASAVVIKKEDMEKHKVDDGPLKVTKAVARARLGPAPDPKDASPPPPPTRSAPSTGPARPAPAPAQPAQAGAPKPAWLQALGDASLLMDDEEEEESPKPKPKPPPPKKNRWEVIGGAGKGGIVVRRGQDVNSFQLPNRLATGAVVEEVEVSGDRLSFKKIKGDGPDTGWVSQTFQGKPLLRRL